MNDLMDIDAVSVLGLSNKWPQSIALEQQKFILS